MSLPLAFPAFESPRGREERFALGEAMNDERARPDFRDGVSIGLQLCSCHSLSKLTRSHVWFSTEDILHESRDVIPKSSRTLM